METERLVTALLQLTAHDRPQFSERWPAILEEVESAAQAGAKLLILPEGTLPAYVIGEEPILPSEIASAESDLLTIATRHNCTIVCGAAAPSTAQRGAYENAALVLGPRGRIAAVGKRFLWHFDRRWFVAGSNLEPIRTPHGRLGILICADVRLPTLARRLTDRGADLLVVSTAWITSGRDPLHLENPLADHVARTRAWENGIPLLAANKVGVELGSISYCGKSQAVGGDGRMLAIASEHRPERLLLDLPLKRGTTHRVTLPVSSSLRATTTPERRRIGFGSGLEADHLAVARWASLDLVLDANRFGEELPPLDRRLGNDHGIAYLTVTDAEIADPGFLPPYRLAGVTLFEWLARDFDEERRLLLAKTRAQELRSYLIVQSEDAAGRGYVIDPDGSVIAGTTAHLRLAQFTYDPGRTATDIAPGTDIIAGLRLIESYEQESDSDLTRA